MVTQKKYAKVSFFTLVLNFRGTQKLFNLEYHKAANWALLLFHIYIYIKDIEDTLSSYIYIYADYTYLFATGTDPTKTENIPNSDLIEI